jgi:hypothetical protein
MIEFDYDLKHGFILPFSELTEVIWLMDLWTINAEFVRYKGAWFAEIRHENQEIQDMPNAIHYLFPVIEDIGADSLICLHPSAAIPTVHGLYFEEEELKHDLLEDWERFWDPLKSALHARR